MAMTLHDLRNSMIAVSVVAVIVQAVVNGHPWFITESQADDRTYAIAKVIDGPLAAAAEIILKEAYGRIGRKVHFEFMPGERAIHSVENGTIDADMFRVSGLTERYPNIHMIPTSFIEATNGLFMVQSGVSAKDWSELQDFTFTFRRGLKIAETHTEGFKRTITPDSKTALRVLVSGRADILIEEKLETLKLMEEMKVRNIVMLPNLRIDVPLYHYVSEDNRALVPLLSEQFEILRQEGFDQRAFAIVQEQLQ